MNCIICNEEINKKNILKKHINHHHNIDELTNEMNYIMSLNIGYETIFDEVKNLYLSGYTVNDIKKLYGVSFSRYIEIIGIKRSASESKKTIVYQERVKSTNLSKYGVENPSQNQEIKQKKKNTFLKHFGYENNFCNFDIRSFAQKNIDYNKVLQTTKENLIIKYGEDIKNVSQIPWVRLKISNSQIERYQNFSEDEKRKMTEIARSNIRYVSSQEIRIQSLLNKLNIEYTCNVFLFSYNWDILFRNKKIIEVQGDFWHGNPKFYKETDILLNGLTVHDVWKKDERKKKLIEKKGYTLYYLWESDINNMSDDEIIKALKMILC